MALFRRITLIALSVAVMAFGLVSLASGPSFAGSIAPAPALISPANDPSNTAIKDLVLKWQPVAGASSYQVQIGRNIDFTNNLVALPNGGVTVATLYEVPIGLPHASYYWRVRALVNGTQGHWSHAWGFLREWEAPINVIQFPSSSDPTLAWSPVPDASEYHVIYDTAPVTADDLLNSLSAGCMTHGTSFTPLAAGEVGVLQGQSFQCDTTNLVAGKTYYWGLAAFDDSSSGELVVNGQAATGCGTKLPECDASVSTGSFSYQPPTGGAVQQLDGLTTSWRSTGNPTTCDLANACPTTPTFSWTPVQGASIYFTRIYLDRDATTIYREYETQTSRFTPPDQFQDAQPGKPYYWQVEAATCGGPGVQCTPPSAANQGCPTPKASSSNARPAAAPSDTTPSPSAPPAVPTITGVSVSPPGPEGNQSMQGGTTGTVTITGTNILSGACAIASGGAVTSVPTAASSGNSMSFGYWAPVDGGSVTFRVENPDGTTSAASSAISVDSSAAAVSLSAISAFQKRSGPVGLISPADGAVRHGNTVTFRWSDYIASGSRGTYDPESYELEVSSDPSFSAPLINQTSIDLTQYTPTTDVLSDGHYYWRVNAVDESGNELTWSAARQLTITASDPTVAFGNGTGGRGLSRPLTIDFSRPVSNVDSSTLLVVPDGEPSSHAVAGKVSQGASPTEYVFTPRHPFALGGTYDLAVDSSVVDANGNPAVVSGAPVRVKQVANTHSVGWSYDHGWRRHTASGALSGQYIEASAGHGASIRVAGNQAELAGCKGPNMGSISITVRGSTQTVSEHQSFTRCGVILWHHALPAGESRLTVTVAGGHGNFDDLKVA